MQRPAVGILGSGFAVPARRVTNDDLARTIDTSDEWIRTRTGIVSRHILSNGDQTSDLATLASERAIADAGIDRDDIDAVIVATVSGDMPFPNLANLVQYRLGLRRGPAFDLSAACAGYIYSLDMAAAMIQTGRAKTVLVVGADALSKMLDWTDRSTCVLFGDGAGATVVSEVEEGYGLLGTHLGADGSGGDLLKVAAPAEDEHGERLLRMAGREVFKFAVRIQAEACQKVLDEAGLTADEVTWLVPHQANIRIIETAAKGLGIPMSRTFINVEKYGNTSAASIPIALAEATAQGLFQRGDNILLVGFGAGLAWGAALLRWPF